MGKQTVDVMVKGGHASAGPPLGSTLGPLKVNVAEIVKQINERTKDMAGMDVPVKVTVDTDTKDFTIEIGTPPVSALVKKELDLKKGSGESGKKRVADMSEEQAKKIARTKFGSDDVSYVNQVKGTCRSMGITIGEGEITEEELKKYEEMDKAKAEEEAAKAAPKEGEEKKEEETGEKKEAPKEESKKEEKPKEKK